MLKKYKYVIKGQIELLKSPTKYDAGALQYTLVIGIVIGIICVAMLLLFEYQLQWKAQVDIESKLISYSQSGIYYGLENLKEGERKTVSLFDEKNNITQVQKDKWGIYKVIQSTCRGKLSDFTTIAMTGGYPLKDSLYVLQIGEKDYPLTLSGNTLIQGNVKVPNGVVRPAIKTGLTYTGKTPLVKGEIKKINALPIVNLNSEYVWNDKNILYKPFENIKNRNIKVSFKDSTQYFKISHDTLHLQNVNLTGNIRLKAKTIMIYPTTKLKDIIIEADKVVVFPYFKGNAQIFAKQIKVESNVIFEYPSALICDNFSSIDSTVLSVGNNSSIFGSVYVGELPQSLSQSRNAQFTMENSSMIKGELFVLSNAKLKGRIYGCAYINSIIEEVGGTKYINYLRDVSIIGDSLPYNFCGLSIHNNTHIVQWLY